MFGKFLTILIDIFFIFIVIVISTNVSNIITRYCKKLLNIREIILAFHLYIVCMLYYFSRLITANIIVDTGSVALIAGPILGYLSNYLDPYLKHYKF